MSSFKEKAKFITGGVKKEKDDEVKAEAWETCNSMVIISRLLASVTELIKKSFMFLNSAAEIWKLLETRFSVANGARKYKLSKVVYEVKQHGRLKTNYYT